jgi:hypothetical protein
MFALSETITYRSEGSYEPTSPYYALTPHQPTLSSGITIGLGYDLGFRRSQTVSRMFRLAGIPDVITRQYLSAVGLRGIAARQFLAARLLPPLTPEQSDRLFALAYAEATADVERICNKEDTVRAYGRTNWATLNPRIRELLIDLRYRGDYTPQTRKLIQRSVVTNDIAALRRTMQDRKLWANVPPDRFFARQRILSENTRPAIS